MGYLAVKSVNWQIDYKGKQNEMGEEEQQKKNTTDDMKRSVLQYKNQLHGKLSRARHLAPD